MKTLYIFVSMVIFISIVSCNVNAEKVLNNLVTELLNVPTRLSQSHSEYKFTNPRQGWVFISSTAEVKDSDKIWILIDSIQKEDALIIHEKGKGKTLEAMRLLPAGEHKINILSEGTPAFENLIVRSIPEIGFMTLNDWQFMKKHKILDNINVVVDYGQREHKTYIERWKKDGKKWIVMCGMPGFVNADKIKLEDSYKYWAEKLMQNPLVDAFQADEISAGMGDYDKKFPVWADAIRKLKKDFPDKESYIYCCGPIWEEAETLKPIMEALKESDGKFLLEAYLTEKPSLEAIQAHIKSRLHDETSVLEKVFPGWTRNTILAIGTYERFGPELNACPNIDFRVFMDMQFQLIATDPGWKGLYGIQNYMSYHEWEETSRWISKLYRHYCIEGKTNLLSKEYGFNLILDHIDNPDFEKGTVGSKEFADGKYLSQFGLTHPYFLRNPDYVHTSWSNSTWKGTIGSWVLSDKETMMVKNMPGLGWKQDRYDVDTHEKIPWGNNFLWTKRREDKPNTFSQEVKNLQPGKCYYVRMWVGDYNNLKAKQTLVSSVNIEGAELLPKKNATWAYGIGPVEGEYFTYFFRVFRAKDKTAKLVISDWANDKEPGGPIDQELMYNFIEVQPYLEEEIEYGEKSEAKQEKKVIGYWKFDEGKGDEVKDLSSNGNDGIIKGIGEGWTKWVEGKSNTALEFDGRKKIAYENGYVQIPGMEEYDLSKGLTVEAWVKPMDSKAGYPNKEIVSNITSIYGPGFRFRICTNESGDASLGFSSGDGTKPWGVTTPGIIKDNIWYHVAGTYDGSIFRIYIDGKEMAASDSGLTLAQGENPFTIGAWATGAADGFNGIIDEVKVYNYARNPEEILEDVIKLK